MKKNYLTKMIASRNIKKRYYVNGILRAVNSRFGVVNGNEVFYSGLFYHSQP
jgi:hypothetical protein